eukprot:COSAG06_NODE_1107_length_10634_cov_44.531903_11_plen_200_part_00
MRKDVESHLSTRVESGVRPVTQVRPSSDCGAARRSAAQCCTRRSTQSTQAGMRIIRACASAFVYVHRMRSGAGRRLRCLSCTAHCKSRTLRVIMTIRWGVRLRVRGMCSECWRRIAQALDQAGRLMSGARNHKTTKPQHHNTTKPQQQHSVVHIQQLYLPIHRLISSHCTALHCLSRLLSPQVRCGCSNLWRMEEARQL